MKNIFARLFGIQKQPTKTEEENEPKKVENTNEKTPKPEEALKTEEQEVQNDEVAVQNEHSETPEPEKEQVENEQGFLTLTDAQTYTHQGKREYQEDNAYVGKHYLIVSDGMGGHAKGDVASEIVVETLVQQLEQLNESEINTPEAIKEQLQTIMQNIVAELNAYATKEPMAYKMGATLAMVLIINDSLYVIHIGDSRVYLFDKQGEIKFITKDHSFVQELIDADVISAEDALTHPRKNVITRVLQAKEGLRVKATINVLENVEHHDKLLICSDGVLEAWRDNGLSVIFGQQKKDNAYIIDEIKKYCIEKSSDNNTAIVATLIIDNY
jgi:serine/threonine protein phosphatase PrpC